MSHISKTNRLLGWVKAGSVEVQDEASALKQALLVEQLLVALLGEIYEKDFSLEGASLKEALKLAEQLGSDQAYREWQGALLQPDHVLHDWHCAKQALLSGDLSPNPAPTGLIASSNNPSWQQRSVYWVDEITQLIENTRARLVEC